MSVTLKTITGKVNLKNKSGKCFVFHAPREGGEGGHREVVLSKAMSEGPMVGKITGNRANFVPSVPGKKRDIVGTMVERDFTLPEGEILKVFCQVSPGYGKRIKSGNVYIRMRQTAAYRKLRLLLCDDASCAYTHAEIEGCFDVLTVDEAEALGVTINQSFRHTASTEARDAVLTENTVIREEVKPAVKFQKQVIETEEGSQVTRIVRKRRRAIKT